jgi:hypothetical protein
MGSPSAVLEKKMPLKVNVSEEGVFSLIMPFRIEIS